MLEYKVVETTTVTDDALERILNEWTLQGWQFESIQFAMAFVLFTRQRNGADQ